MDDYVDFFKNKNKNENTDKATGTWMKIYTTWAVNNNFAVNILLLNPEELNNTLENFFANVIRQDGKNYEPSSLGCLQAVIDRYLKLNGYQNSISKDEVFLMLVRVNLICYQAAQAIVYRL